MEDATFVNLIDDISKIEVPEENVRTVKLFKGYWNFYPVIVDGAEGIDNEGTSVGISGVHNQLNSIL